MTLQEKYDIVVGLEVHAQLSTRSKIFCSDNTDYGAEPNTQVSPVSLAHPGTLPVMNKEVIASAIKLGLALQCSINRNCWFERKNYFYPDLPKGYQVTQQAKPICIGGVVEIFVSDKQKNIRLNRIHMEEDAGKSIHDTNSGFTNIDLNRAGVPLLEIVSEPDISSAEEAYEFLTELRKIVRWINVCDGNMEEGSMRCDANISIKLKGDDKLGTRVEVKNLNSIRNVKRAIEIESVRLMKLHNDEIEIIQETRSYDADNNSTFSLRSKEDANDYRYFPEPDLPAFLITDEYISEIRASLPEQPSKAKEKLMKGYSLNSYDASSLVIDKETYSFFQDIIKYTTLYKSVANWINGPVKFYCNEKNISVQMFPLSPKKISELIEITESGMVHFNVASTKLMSALIDNPEKEALEIAQELKLLQQSDNVAIEEWIDTVISKMPEKVLEYRKGKKSLQGMFAGEVKKLSKGRADMQLVMELLIKKLN